MRRTPLTPQDGRKEETLLVEHWTFSGDHWRPAMSPINNLSVIMASPSSFIMDSNSFLFKVVPDVNS